MELFSKYQVWRNKPGKGVSEPPSDKGFKRFAFIFSTHFTKLICLNILLIAFSIPIITIPASLAGMTRVLMRLTRDGVCDLWTDFWEEFKTCFAPRLLSWLILNIIPVIIAIILSIIIPGFEVLWAWLPLYAFSLIIQGYLFPVTTIIDVSLSENIRNAVALSIMEWKKSMLILVIVGGIQLLCFMFFPVSIIIIALFSFSVSQLAVCIVVNEPIQKHLIRYNN